MSGRPYRVLVLVPFPMTPAQLAKRGEQQEEVQLPTSIELEFRSTRAAPSGYVSAHDYVLADITLLEAGMGAETEGFDAVCIDTVSDSGVAALRSLLDIPVIAPGQTMFTLALLLGRRFGILTMWERWRGLYERTLRSMAFEDRCAGVRSIDVHPDSRNLFEGKENEILPALLEAANLLIDEDGADVICLGSTTMHQAHTYLRERLSVPVLNPGPLSYLTADMMLALGLSHSRSAYPRPLEPKLEMIEAMLSAAAESGNA